MSLFIGSFRCVQKKDVKMRSVFVLCILISLFSVNCAVNIPPLFTESEYIVDNLKERADIGTPVLNVTATDEDGDEITYVLDAEAGSKFKINNKTGEVFLNALLTKQEYPDRISFEVFAYDDFNGPEHKVSANVYVILDDVNDNTPRFINEPYEEDISENANFGTIVLQVSAVDDDPTPKYGLVSYKINSGNEDGKFNLATYHGYISVLDILSFDEKTQYVLNISAMDGGGNQDVAMVTINVLDYDNLPAVFDARTYLASVREDAQKGFAVIRVSAHDGDSLNASVEYLLDPDSNKNNIFAVNNVTGVITVNGTLDREKTSSYLLRIGAKSTYHAAVYTTVSIQVLDVNDNSPQFEKNVYEAFVPENSPVDLTVLQVTATDADVGENATLQYILVGANDKFDVRSSGQIVVKANIDREEKSQYKFVVTAQETLTPERYESNVTIIINITDVNDHNPSCSQGIYKVTVDENRPNGTFVAQVLGVDADAGQNAEIRFSLDSELDGHSSYFTLDPVSGNITTLQPLDREMKSSFTLEVTLKDQATVEQKRSGSCFVHITVGDQNDNIPKFISLLNATSVAEDASPGTVVVTIKALDEDVSSNAEVRYQIVSGNINNTFHLNNTSGVLTTRKSLDRESISQYNLVVNATDSGGMSQTDVLIISISDQNDNPPEFHHSGGYTFAVDENSAALLVGIVQATDADLGKNAEIVYSINSSAVSDNFVIEPSTGTIRTAVPLDRETTDMYMLTVTAEDAGTPSLSTSVTVYINVSDVNDNTPYFSLEHYTVSLAENEDSMNFLNLTASDKDLGLNSKLRYSILTGNAEGYFTVDSSTGQLSTTKTLDYEKDKMFTLLVQVHDLDGNSSYGQSFHDNAVVYVSVQDVNDHSPTFTKSSYEVRLYENITIGSEVILIRATDEDSGDNKVIEYSFASGAGLENFYIDMNSGRITVKSQIDRDPPLNQTMFNITVMAKDNGNPSLNSTAQLFITVDDVNDNAPTFTQAEYTVQLAENSAAGKSLIQLSCVDNDEGSNGQFVFMIRSGINQASPEFHIDNKTGLITNLVELDYDQGVHEFRLVVDAVDNGHPQLVGSTSVVIQIENTNDNTPQFTQDSYSFSIQEGSYIGMHQTVGMVTANDMDSDGESPYGRVYYSFEIESSEFSINNITGEITTNVTLDREETSHFMLRVIAQDGDPVAPRSNSTAVYITIVDENDNSPEFTKSHETFRVFEDVAVGFSVANITAVDPDEGLNGEVYYSILSGNTDSYFTFNTLTGEVKTNKLLDRENVASYLLVIQAHDRGSPSSDSLAFITIVVDDVNDNAPVITTTSYTSSVRENLPAGQLVCKVSATDSDNGVNKQVSFSLNYPEFAVNSSGFVYTTGSLDREHIAEYDIKIVATDHGTPSKSSSVTVKVKVEDANDNYPVFSEDLYSLLISENATVGSEVIQVTATDLDAGVNSELTYTLTGGQGHFMINRTSGQITMVTPVDHESTPDGFVVHVTASDRGIPSEKSTKVQVNIGVSNVNDNIPVFEQYGYVASVNESSPLGTLVVRVLAQDRDEGLLGEVTYSIIDGNFGDVFSVNNSGYIIISKKLDRETREFYELSVKATDKAGIPKSAVIIVNIRVLDINDNSPMILNAPVHLQVNETSPVTPVLFTLLAHDADLRDTNKRVTFETILSDGFLTVNSDTGAVSLSQSLDYATKQSHVLRVQATDHGDPALHSPTVNVTLTVISKDSTIPVFQQPSYMFNISEDTGIDTRVGTLQASQRNPAPGSSIVYEITSGNSEGIFHIQDSSGALALVKALNRESQFSYTLIVTATNSEDSNQVGHTVVTILITDVNDSPPVFQFKNYQAEVEENSSPGTKITVLEAYDPDEITAELQYNIVEGNEDRKFAIATETMDGINVAEISVAGNLDRETTEYYTLTISVSDGKLKSNCSLRIKVKDVNDNDPVFHPTSYRASVPENSIEGFSILKVTAVDADIGENADITYAIAGSQAHFSIDASSGEITTTAEKLDRETRSSYAFQVTATDPDGRRDDANVIITVSDQNDNAPVFNPLSYSTDITEGANTPRRSVITVSATDIDEGENREIVYSITRGNIGDTFSINNTTGEITVANAVDREIGGLGTNTQGHKIFTLTVTASDLGSQPLTSTTEVTVQVNDINDNYPVFPDSGYSFMISHDADEDMVVIVVMATDEDGGDNGRVSYEILRGNAGWAGDFSIHASSGVIKTVNKLNRDLGYQYNLTIKATDHGTPQLSATTDVILTVGPSNEHSPVLMPVNYTINVYENNLPQKAVLNITATDADEGQNGELTYSIVRGNNHSYFDLTSQSSYGTLVVVSRLDRETKEEYTLEIMAKDGGIPTAKKATGFVTVNVLDLNDHAPQFMKQNYTGRLMENSGPGVTVQMEEAIFATDSDLGINAEILYSIAGSGSEQFVIDRITAVLKTRVSSWPTLDHETTPSYTFNIIATDQAGNGLQSTVPITIHLIDENDNSPQFLPMILRVSISESTAVDDVVTTIHAADPDPGLNGQVTYSIISGAQGMFEVGKSNGNLRVPHGLDREQRDEYRINVSALDGNLNPRQGFGLVIVTILDDNDNRPVFEKLEYTASVSESVPIGYEVLTVRAVDVDLGMNSNVSYYVEHEVFIVHNITGAINTRAALDRETVGSYSFKVYARDTWGLESSVTVNIAVDDVNDNAPYFPKSDIYRSDVTEETPVGSVVLNIVAQDDDVGKNAELQYSLARNVGDLFEIDSETGILRLKNTLNKASLVALGHINTTGLMALTVRAQDGGNLALSTDQKVVLRLLASTDVTPVFDRSVYIFNISQEAEIGDEVGTVHAVTKSGSSVLTYTFGSPRTYFAVDGNNGQLSTAASLYDVDERYHIFTVRVTDGFSNSGFTSVVVGVLGVNKHSPQFQFMSPYKMSISERASPGTGIGMLKATDEDWGENGLITYRFLEANVGLNGEMVAVDNSCFLPLGLESVAVLASDITASSFHSEPNKDFRPTQGRLNNKPSTQAGVTYQGAWCASIADLTPFIQVDFGRLKKITRVATQGRPDGTSYVSKYSLTHSVDGNTWTQHDQTFSGNMDAESVVVQRILPSFKSRFVRLHPLLWNEQSCLRMEYYGCNSDGGDEVSIPFFIDENTGEVNVSDQLDRETQEKYMIKVEASDRGNPALQGDTMLEISVLDSNDNTPSFEKTAYHVSLSERTFPGDMVVRVSASDNDEGINGEVTYTIVSGRRGKFTIEATTGIIQPSSRLDYEDPSDRYFILNISASDHGSPSLSSYVPVYINVTDFNDNYPEFIDASLTSEVKENLDPGILITTIQATDADSGNNSMVRYSLLEASDKFSLDSTTGEVRTTQTLDREETGNYVIKIRATDLGDSPLSTDGELLIKIIDENDNRPQFTEDVYTRKIKEDSPVGAVAVTLKAEDRDIGLNGKVSYTITEGNEKGLFGLDNTTGIVTVEKSLDREVNHTVRFTVRGQDQTAPFYFDRADVTVMVTDVNDNAPVIEPKDMTVVISEGVPIGTFIVDVNATDKDSSNNAELVYSIVHGSHGHFSVDANTGVVRTAVKLDYETIVHYTVLVMVRDTGVTGYMDFGSIDITLIDVNDNGPVFYVPTGPFNIGENKARGSNVGLVRAFDADIGENTDITFAITGGDPNGHFAIGSLSGIISTTQSLDREMISFYDVIVTASNSQTTPILSTNVTVRINVDDENDNPPEFNASSYQGRVSENATVGTVVARVFAKDRDKDEAAVIRYSIVSGEHSGRVEIDSRTGILTLSQSLLENEYRNLVLMVNATDNGDPLMSSVVPVVILVDDINDNPPRFDKRQYSASVGEMAKIGDSVVQMIAVDADTESSGATTYELVSGHGLNDFRIASDTGWISVNKPLDRETVAEYRLSVRASNLVQQKRRKRRRRREAIFSDTVELVINIDDANDNIPVFSPLYYVGGVMRGADVGTLIVSVIATDADNGINSQLAYNVTGDKKNRFHVNAIGDVVSTDVAVGSAGTMYNLNITATDNIGLGSSSLQPASVKIYVLSRDEQVMLLALVPPDMIKNNTKEFIDMLNNITGGQAYIDKIKKVSERNGSGVIVVGSEVIFHVVRNYTILTSDQIISTIELHRHLLDTLYAKWHVQKVSKIRHAGGDDDDDLEDWEIALIVLGVLLALALLFCCCFCFCCGWKRQFSDEAGESQRKTFFTNSPVTRQKADSTSSDSIQFYSSHPNNDPFKPPGTITNPVYNAEFDPEGYEEKEMELSLSDEESDTETGRKVSKKGRSFKKSFRK